LLGFAVPFTSLSKLCKNSGFGQTYFDEPKCEVWTFPHPDFNFWGHILSTSGVALVKFSCNSEKFSSKIKACYTIVGED
jgi:hypothetical protein